MSINLVSKLILCCNITTGTGGGAWTTTPSSRVISPECAACGWFVHSTVCPMLLPAAGPPSRRRTRPHSLPAAGSTATAPRLVQTLRPRNSRGTAYSLLGLLSCSCSSASRHTAALIHFQTTHSVPPCLTRHGCTGEKAAVAAQQCLIHVIAIL